MAILIKYGGLNAAIIRLPGFLLSFYTPKFLRSSMAHDMPMSRKKHRKARTKMPSTNASYLTSTDTKNMFSEVEEQT